MLGLRSVWRSILRTDIIVPEEYEMTTYKERFEDSEQKAHTQNIATKILRELSALRASVEASSTARKRWVWELLQNAKDVNIGGTVKVLIEADLESATPHVTFRHTGQPFSAENIRFLIEQISSKDRKKDSSGRPKTTGKFGTGFLTTHLLSEIVTVTGIAKEDDLTPRQFQLTLDRRGFEPDEIAAAVEGARRSVLDLDQRPTCKSYVPGAFNTSFRYDLTDDTGRNVAKAGLEDLHACLRYTLGFVREIDSVALPQGTFALQTRIPLTEGEVQILQVTLEREGQKHTRSMATLTQGFTTVAIPVARLNGTIDIQPLGAGIPRLFCDFPLLGTETFPFPVVVNDPNFNPTDARDGVFLTSTARVNPQSTENKQIVKAALSLYLLLLKHAAEHSWENLHRLAAAHPIPSHLTWVDAAWYKNEILTPIRQALLYAPVVRTAKNGERAAILSADGNKYIWFPSAAKKELRAGIWECARWWFPHCLPQQSDVEVWHNLIWEECGQLTTTQLAQFVANMKTIVTLGQRLTDKKVNDWLNEFYALLKSDESEYDTLINHQPIFPNQNGTFRKRAELFRQAGEIPDALKDVLSLLGIDIRDQLIAAGITTDIDELQERDQAWVVKEITAAVHEKATDRTHAKNHREAFKKLLLWFREDTARANRLFPALYQHKYLLYDDDEILDSIERSEQLGELLQEFDVKNVQELRNIISSKTATAQLLPVTQEIIARMGITSIEEWTEALQDKDLAALFSHESTPTTDMFVYAQSLIVKAKERIIEHLRNIETYDLTDMDETAPTILAGITKAGQSVMIVTRPAYDGEVIIYYGSERDVLDYEDSELWIDDGKNVRRVTMGHMLKTTEIRRFPI